MNRLEYDTKFFNQQLHDNISSAQIIIPIVLSYIKEACLDSELSVIDLGCGTGNWLSVCKSYGCKVVGVDGGSIPDDLLLIDKSEFVKHDLREYYKDDNKYSLAISLECAEHITASGGDYLIKALTTLSDIVLFSAAIPYQRGKGHINEQYQSHWIRKFNERNFQELDVIRPKVWNNRSVRGFYAQNMFLFVKKDTIAFSKLERYTSLNHPEYYNIIHPDVWENLNNYKIVRLMDKLHGNRIISYIYYKFCKQEIKE